MIQKEILEHFQKHLFMDENVKMEDELNFLLWIKRTFMMNLIRWTYHMEYLLNN
jgi:hypothetical protein